MKGQKEKGTNKKILEREASERSGKFNFEQFFYSLTKKQLATFKLIID